MQQTAEENSNNSTYWFRRGMREAICLPTFILICAFIGFAGFAKASGITLLECLTMTVFIWALPACVVLVTAISSGATLLAAFIAVTLSSARLMPMVIAIVPEMRSKSTSVWRLLFLSHFVAVTAWVISMERFKSVPKHGRSSFFLGLVLVINALVHPAVVAVYLSADSLPAEVLGALFFLTPIYFLLSLWGSARENTGRIALIVGLLLGPIFYIWLPGFDLLLTGFIGGTIAYLIGRFLRRGEA
jgi:predicted branched-subunit amino acid permease